MAAGGSGATTRAHAAHRRAPSRKRGRCRISSLGGGVSAGAGKIRLEHRHNVRIDIRWATDNSDAVRRHAAELAALAPDVVLAPGASTLGPLLQVTRTVPIVFAIVADPVGAGFIDSLARPGGNATGFTSFEYAIGGKWLELLKQIGPDVTRIAILRDPATPSGTGQFGVIQAMAPSLKVEVSPVNLRNAAEIESAVTAVSSLQQAGWRSFIAT